jgi:hypothetical protein
VISIVISEIRVERPEHTKSVIGNYVLEHSTDPMIQETPKSANLLAVYIPQQVEVENLPERGAL